MLWRHDGVRRTPKRIGTRRIDGDRIARRRTEVDLGSFAATDPIALLGIHAIDEVDLIQPVEELLRVFGNFQHPLAFNLVRRLGTAALTLPVDDLLIREDAKTRRTPVDRHLFFEGETVFVELQKNPLRPLIVIGVGRIDLARPVKTEPE